MPEASETKLTTDFLHDMLVGRMITRWGFVGGKYTDQVPEGFAELEAALPVRVEEVSCHGKFIYFKMKDADGGCHVAMHSLMMSGRWRSTYDDYCKWFMDLDGGSDIWFSDPRSLGTISFTTDPQVLKDKLVTLGLDILTEHFTLPLFKELVQKRGKLNITSFLMDQSILSGCGNIIKTEALYDACISPLRKIGSLSENEQELLYQAVRVIPRLAYNHGGISMKNFDVDGQKGRFQKQLKVYGKKDALRTKTADGRTTYWYPNRQL
jgi:DNA-formamidopyrimidine glycosylase